jgi:hypothetical protein
VTKVLPSIAESALLGGLVFVGLYYLLVHVSLGASGTDRTRQPQPPTG